MKPIGEQVVVITGASSGIGRATAQAFGEKGARVVLAARSVQGLSEAAQEVEQAGGKVHTVVTDVSDWMQVQQLAQESVDAFGRIDTWVNNAGIAVYGTVEETDLDEIERVIQVNLMGEIYGMKAALPIMKKQGEGVIINVASALAERSVPYQAAYSAAKHGIKGFTETLRVELEHENSGVKVTLIEPSSINTPLFNHARSKLGVMPKPIPPIYEPEVVAEAILAAAENPTRRVVVGAAKALTILERINPNLVDWYMTQGGRMFKQQMTGRGDDGMDNLFEPVEGSDRVRGEFDSGALPTSPYTRYIEQNPNIMRSLALAALAGAVLGIWALGRRS